MSSRSGDVSFIIETIFPVRLYPQAEGTIHMPGLRSSEMMKWQTLRNVAAQ